jgi:N-acetylglucosaminyl-diphospho-decaprenol L-rhamnosyltransferase
MILMPESAVASNGERRDARMNASVSVIIVNWHSAELLGKCMQSIERQWAASEAPLPEVVVVDNASFDKAGEVAHSHGAIFVQVHENVGFARANNIGARRAKGSLLLFLNPDTEMTPGALEPLITCARVAERAGAVGACLLNTDGSFQESCIQTVPSVANQLLDLDALHHARFIRARGSARALGGTVKAARVPAVSGACLLVARNAFDAVGGFCEEYFMYGEDVDLCCRLARAGYRNYTVMSSFVVHHGGASTGARYSLSVQRTRFQSVMKQHSMWQFMRMRRGPVTASAYRGAMLASALIRLGVLFSVQSNPQGRKGRSITASLCMAKWKWWFILQWALGAQRDWLRKAGA